MILCWQVLVLPRASRAVQVTKLVPSGNAAGALFETVTAEQALTTGTPKPMNEAEHAPASVFTVKSPGQVSAGGALLGKTMTCWRQVEKLPLVIVVANNQYAYSTPNRLQFACRSLLDKAVGYGIEGEAVDGTDLGACLEVLTEAANKARTNRVPQLIVADLLRLCGHGEHDDAGYVDAAMKCSSVGRDCLKVAETHLLKQSWAEPGDLASWRNSAVEKVEETVAQVQRETGPDPYREDWCALASKHLAEGHDASV